MKILELISDNYYVMISLTSNNVEMRERKRNSQRITMTQRWGGGILCMPRSLQRWSKVGYPNGMERQAIYKYSIFSTAQLLLLIRYTLSLKRAACFNI